MTTVVEAIDLVRSFGQGNTRVIAVNGVSLQARPKELLVVMGPSGSGKTTLLAMLGCLLRPDSGIVRICGREVARMTPLELARLRAETIGFVFQSFNLLSALSAWENVAVVGGLLPQQTNDLRQQATALLERAGLGNRLEHLPADLSAGEKQRVALARALFNSPRVILADEPTASLDAHNGRQVGEMLRQVADDQGCSVIIASHDERIRHLADRVLWLEDGKLKRMAP